MPVIASKTMFVDGGLGWIDQYATLTKGYTDFYCGCGHPIKIAYRKEYKNTAPYEFKITHRNKKNSYTTKEPNALAVFDRMLKVSTYVGCDFAGQRHRWR